jgi:Ser/Thr protein kinase RdoA (MazF antagonist)
MSPSDDRLQGISFENILKGLEEGFGFDDVSEPVTVSIGYEDFNFIASSGAGKIFVKVFSASRDRSACLSYVNVVVEATAAGVQHPRLYTVREDSPRRVSGSRHLACVETHPRQVYAICMEFLPGASLYDDPKPITLLEGSSLLNQIIALNSLVGNETKSYDHWSTRNLDKEFAAYGHCLGRELGMVTAAVERIRGIDQSQLPTSLVHGDLVPTNLIRDGAGSLFVIDFGRVDLRPRIYDFAVVLAQVLADPFTAGSGELILETVVEKYSALAKLDTDERRALPDLACAVNASIVIGANRVRIEGGDSEENQYWLSRSAASLDWLLSAAGQTIVQSALGIR